MLRKTQQTDWIGKKTLICIRLPCGLMECSIDFPIDVLVIAVIRGGLTKSYLAQVCEGYQWRGRINPRHRETCNFTCHVWFAGIQKYCFFLCFFLFFFW